MQQENATLATDYLPAELIPLMVVDPEFALLARTLNRKSKEHADLVLSRRPAYLRAMLEWREQVCRRCGTIRGLLDAVTHEARWLPFRDAVNFSCDGYEVSLTWDGLTVYGKGVHCVLRLYRGCVMWTVDMRDGESITVYLLGAPGSAVVLTMRGGMGATDVSLIADPEPGVRPETVLHEETVDGDFFDEFGVEYLSGVPVGIAEEAHTGPLVDALRRARAATAGTATGTGAGTSAGTATSTGASTD